MAGVVHGGALGRWFEELCRIDHQKLSEVVSRNRGRLAPSALPNQGGVYAFWWTGKHSLLRSSRCNRRLALHGPGGRPVHLKIDNEWLGLATGLPVPLYVGKNSGNIATRIGQHLLLGSPRRILPAQRRAKRGRRPTTSCQLRAGIEHLFQTERNPVDLILKNVGLSYVLLDGDDNSANRFYLEDLAIGLMRPPLNVDVER